MILKFLLVILASIVLLALALYVLPRILMYPVIWLFPQSGLAMRLRLFYTANIVSQCVLRGYTRRGHFLNKDQFGRLRICIPNHQILVAPEDRYVEEVLNQLARELALRLGFTKGRASVLGDETVFLFSTAESTF